MTDETTVDLLGDLLQTLKAERDALLEGRFEELAETVLRKEELLTRLSNADPDDMRDDLEIVRERLAENEKLLGAAQKGFSQANARISDIRNAIGQLKTYDGAGQVTSNRTTDPTVSLKA